MIQIKNRWAFIISLGALLSLSLFLRFYNLSILSPWPDEIYYTTTASHLIHNFNGIAYMPAGDLRIFMARPIFVVLSAFLQWFGIESLLSGRVISALFGSLSVLVLYFLTVELSYDRTTALLTAVLSSLLSSHVLHSRTAQLETLQLFWVILCYTLFLAGDRRDNVRLMVLAALCLGLGVWVKETTLGSILVLLLYSVYRQKSILSVFQKRFLVFFAVFGTILIPLIFILAFVLKMPLTFVYSIRDPNSTPISLSQPISILAYLKETMGNVVCIWGSIDFRPYKFFIVILVLLIFLNLIRSLKRNPSHWLTFFHVLVYSTGIFMSFRQFSYYWLTVVFLFLPVWSKIVVNAVLLLRQVVLGKEWVKLVASGRVLLSGCIVMGAVFVVAVNVKQSLSVLSDRGSHDGYRTATMRLAGLNMLVAASHPAIVRYWLAREAEHNSIEVVDLVQAKNNALTFERFLASNIRAIIVKPHHFTFYFTEREREQICRSYPIKEDHGAVVLFMRK